ncbi:RHS repeat-associated core domain-containing protein [Leptospira adleri]|uniref:RHS repeat-associated core domain-containing protein n=1 Tax=Leptospira adleri TaxID=2023186 RepID=UPI001083796C|nr:RHS repeat-associated core domain-containing protein [Leptospira adleri]TGM58869.1 RHS repeat-associated core domain-containing protein [Leptospira adleri]
MTGAESATRRDAAGCIPIGGTPVNGFVFFNTDHLGSVTMAMDGQGNRLGGGEWGGSSHVSYKPYGEVQRNDSQGPDIFRYKYTGQEEDRETGLYYYKARYYDPEIGRFTQADSILDTKNPNSMDLYMYTEGNPVNHTDPSGNSIGLGAIAAITFPMFSLPTIGAAAVGVAIMASVVIASALAAIGLGTSLGYMGLNGAPVVAGAVGIAALATLNSALYLIASGAGVTFAYASGAATFVGIATAMGIGLVSSISLVLASSAGGASILLRNMAANALALTSSIVFSIGITAVVTAVGAAAAVVAFAPYTAISMAVFAVTAAVTLGMVLFVTALATAAWLAGTAIGSILSPYAVQGYITGGLSKSSFNNIHWDEKSARIGGCYGAAVSFWGMQAGLYTYVNGLVYASAAKTGNVFAQAWVSFNETAVLGPFSGFDIVASQFTIYSVLTGDYNGAGYDVAGYVIKAYAGESAPIGLGVKAGQATEKVCKGAN